VTALIGAAMQAGTESESGFQSPTTQRAEANASALPLLQPG
jgi:hypothetical protein